jgi:hypothetical protein
MTYVVAVVCTDGVVLASDGQAERIADCVRLKETAQKIFRFRNSLWGIAGAESGICDFSEFSKSIDQDNQLMDTELLAHLEDFALKVKEKAKAENHPNQCNQYLVVWHNDKPMAWWMDNVCRTQRTDEYIRRNIIPIGAGQPVTHSLIGSLEGREQLYTLKQGSLIAYRLVREAINSSAVVGPPIAVWTLSNNQPPKKKSDEGLKELEFLYNKWIDGERLITDGILSSLG